MDEQQTTGFYIESNPVTLVGTGVEATDFIEQIKKQDATNQKIYNKINKVNTNLTKTQKQLSETIKLMESAGNVIHDQGENIESLLNVVEKQQDSLTEIVNQMAYMKECDNTQLQAINAIDKKTGKELVKLYGFSIFVVALNIVEFFLVAFHIGLIK